MHFLFFNSKSYDHQIIIFISCFYYFIKRAGFNQIDEIHFFFAFIWLLAKKLIITILELKNFKIKSANIE